MKNTISTAIKPKEDAITNPAQTTMKAIQVKAYGGAEQLSVVEVPMPHAEAGEVLVRIQASSFNALDAKIASGVIRKIFPVQFPYIPGGDFSGVVESIGKGVKEFQAGDPVYGYSPTACGAYAEYMAIAANKIARKPKSIGYNEAASLACVGQTALQMMDRGHVQKGKSVLIQGAGGAVGSVLVQVAHDRRAKVIAVVSTADIDRVRSYGADQVIDRTTTRFENSVKEVDTVLDTVGGEVLQLSYGVLKPGGIVVAITEPPSQEEAEKHHVTASMLNGEVSSANLEALAQLIDAGKIKPYIGKVYAQSDVVKAWQDYAAKRSNGKIVFTVAAWE